jgi:hypothetical protein
MMAGTKRSRVLEKELVIEKGYYQQKEMARRKKPDRARQD